MRNSAFKKPEFLIIASFVVIKLIFHLIADVNWSLDGDEVYHIEAGRHLAWGYITFPPMIGLFAWIQNLIPSESVFIHHLLVHLAASSIYILCGLIILKLNGGWKALILCYSSILAAPTFGITHNIFQPVIFLELFWIWSFYILISYLKRPHEKYFYFMAIILAIAFLTKYSIVFFIAGLFFSIIIFKPGLLKKRNFWLPAFIFLLIIMPNVAWQFNNDLPLLKHFSALYHSHLQQTDLLDNLYILVWYLNPLTLLLWIPGLFIIPFLKKFEKYKLGFFALTVSFLIMVFVKGKFYYLYPIILICLSSGSVLAELYFTKKKILILYTYSLILLVTSVVAIPYGLTLLPRDTYSTIFQKNEKSDLMTTFILSFYYYQDTWDMCNINIKRVYDELPYQEKENCLTWGSSYQTASEINLSTNRYNIPKAFSFHCSHYTWIKEFDKNTTIIALHNIRNEQEARERIKYYYQFFKKVELKKIIYNPESRYENQNYFSIYLCKDMKHSFKTFKSMMKHRIFE
jgi:hypothetical protein